MVPIYIREDDADPRAMFDKALASALADGTVKNLSIKWFQLDITPPASESDTENVPRRSSYSPAY